MGLNGSEFNLLEPTTAVLEPESSRFSARAARTTGTLRHEGPDPCGITDRLWAPLGGGGRRETPPGHGRNRRHQTRKRLTKRTRWRYTKWPYSIGGPGALPRGEHHLAQQELRPPRTKRLSGSFALPDGIEEGQRELCLPG